MDQLGSVSLVVNASTGAIAQRMDYDEFGRVLADTSPGFQAFGYAGGLHDPDTGLARFGARDYDADSARWTAKDPLLFGGDGENLYAYVLLDPVNQIDCTREGIVDCAKL
jgi:RHS repeat-associated protein